VNPASAALVTRDVTTGFGAAVAQGIAPALPPNGEPQPAGSDLKDELRLQRPQNETEALLDKFKSDTLAGKRAGILPIHVSFPAFGPSLFLVSELTGENQSPSVVLSFQRDKKAGGK
jgi:hypothetical protein